jgi:hypothetical protein
MRLGADPEVFMSHPNEGGLVSVIGHIGGTKWKPLQVENLPQGFTLQQDNVALEFGIPPASTADEYVDFIRKVKDAGLSFFKGLVYSDKSCAIFPEEQMQNPEAFKFGCEPDYNAWTGQVNPSPEPPHPLMRSAGGHVHIETKLPKRAVIQAMDLHVSVPAVLIDNGIDRKKIYGKAGAYRPKKYGVEYRTPSNFWIFQDGLVRWMWDTTAKALEAVDAGERYIKYRDRIVNCINTNDKHDAEKLIKEFHLA